MASRDGAPDTPQPDASPAVFWLLLLIVLAVAAGLRLPGISWGLRHPVHRDEQDFVLRVVQMVNAGDFDHRWYQYPGLFLYLLGAGVASLGPERGNGPDAYWICRLIVASFGVLNAGLLFAIGWRLIGIGGGFAAALLLAASPIDVHAFHQVRADVVLQTLGILAIPALRRLGPGLRGDVRMGALIGLATAVKFTGLLMVPSYLFGRVVAGRRWAWGFLIAGSLTIAITLACTPYAILHADRYFARSEYNGVLGGPATYYQGESRLGEHLVFFLTTQARSWGALATVLFFVGLAFCLRESWRSWAPPLLHSLTTLIAMSAASMVFARHLAPAMGIVYLMAAVPIERVFQWNRLAALLLTAAAVTPSMRASVERVTWFVGPSAQDKALDWIEAHVPPGARILETRPGTTIGGHPGAMIGIDPKRYELMFLRTDEDRAALPLLSPHMDLVITGPGEGWGRGLDSAYDAAGPHGNVVLKLRRPRQDPAGAYARVDLSRARLTASENPPALDRLRDGVATSSWTTAHPMIGTEWLQIDFDAPTRVAAIELRLLHAPERNAPELQVASSVDGQAYAVVRAVEGRPPVSAQREAGSDLSQRLVLDPQPVRSLRIAQRGRRPEPWSVAELIVHEKREPGDSASVRDGPSL